MLLEITHNQKNPAECATWPHQNIHKQCFQLSMALASHNKPVYLFFCTHSVCPPAVLLNMPGSRFFLANCANCGREFIWLRWDILCVFVVRLELLQFDLMLHSVFKCWFMLSWVWHWPPHLEIRNHGKGVISFRVGSNYGWRHTFWKRTVPHEPWRLEPKPNLRLKQSCGNIM